MAKSDSTTARPRLNIANEVAALQRMTVGQLRAKYAEVFAEQTRSRHKEYLIKRIAWRMQANAEGGLSERALRRAIELANDADLRIRAPRTDRVGDPEPAPQVIQRRREDSDPRIPVPGTVITRNYKGRAIHVTVRTNGFEFDGEVYPSLTAVAKVITGKHWNGFHFFGLSKKGADQ